KGQHGPLGDRERLVQTAEAQPGRDRDRRDAQPRPCDHHRQRLARGGGHRARLRSALCLAARGAAAVSEATEESHRRLLRARDAMDRTYAEPLDVPALARIAHTSPAHFSRTFRETFGETPHRYLQRRRIERAMFLLRMTDRDVTEICLDVGFSSLG